MARNSSTSTAEPVLNSESDRDRDEIVIEIATQNNGYVLFGPLGNEKLRGRWDSRNVARSQGELPAALSECHFYPGIRLGVNLRTGVTRRFDAIALPEFANELRTINRIFKAYSHFFGTDQVAAWPEHRQGPEGETPERTANRLKDWLFCMRRLVDNKQAVIVEGSAELPKESVIREQMPGARRRNHSSEHWTELDDNGNRLPSQVDAVPLRGSREPQGAAA